MSEKIDEAMELTKVRQLVCKLDTGHWPSMVLEMIENAIMAIIRPILAERDALRERNKEMEERIISDTIEINGVNDMTSKCPVKTASPWSKWKNYCNEFVRRKDWGQK